MSPVPPASARSEPSTAAPRRGRLAVLASGRGSNLATLLAACKDGQLVADVVVVVSDNDDAPALDLARDAGVPAVAVSWAKHRALGGSRDGFDARVADVVARHNPDLVILAGYMRIVGAPMLEAFDDRLLNLHPALPGAFAGTDAIARAHQAFAEGKLQRTGVMVHRVTAVVDGGDPIAIEAVAMVDGESVDALAVRMHEAEHRVIVRAVARALPAAMADCDHRDALEHRSPR